MLFAFFSDSGMISSFEPFSKDVCIKTLFQRGFHQDNRYLTADKDMHIIKFVHDVQGTALERKFDKYRNESGVGLHRWAQEQEVIGWLAGCHPHRLRPTPPYDGCVDRIFGEWQQANDA